MVDTREYVDALRSVVEEGKETGMIISGDSMTPFLIHERDAICFRKPDTPLRAGDMVFFQRDNGRYVMHRICRIRPDGYYLAGDAQTAIEGPIRRDQIFARITRVRRKGTWLQPGCFWWEFFAHVWIRIIPLRPILVRLYGLPHRRRKD